VTNSDYFTAVQYFANSNLIGTGFPPDYSAAWSNAAAGQYQVVAQAIDLVGDPTTSAPANIIVGQAAYLWGMQMLSTGQPAFFYNPYANLRLTWFGSKDNLATNTNFTLAFQSGYPGLYVDESAPVGGPRFYRVVGASK
jgi:hypothetical protein